MIRASWNGFVWTPVYIPYAKWKAEAQWSMLGVQACLSWNCPTAELCLSAFLSPQRSRAQYSLVCVPCWSNWWQSVYYLVCLLASCSYWLVFVFVLKYVLTWRHLFTQIGARLQVKFTGNLLYNQPTALSSSLYPPPFCHTFWTTHPPPTSPILLLKPQIHSLCNFSCISALFHLPPKLVSHVYFFSHFS